MHGEPPEDVDRSSFDDDGDDGPLRGWVPPDDRLWLHPSERGTAASPSPTPAPPPARIPGGRWVVGGLAVCAAATLVAAGMALASTDATPGTTLAVRSWTGGVPTTEVDLSSVTSARHISQVARPTSGSTVALLVDRPGHTTVGTGVVAEAGGIVVALAPTVAGARSVTVVEPDGTRQSAVRVGSDATTGITVLRIGDDLPAVTFDTADPRTGSVGVVEAVEDTARPGVTPAVRLYAGTVLYAGVAADGVPGDEFCATGVEAPLSASDVGSPLVDTSGGVSGILDAVEGAGAGRTAVFLPAELVQDVTDQIVSRGWVAHGSLGAGVADPAPDIGPAGAEVRAVVAGGAAQLAGLEPGDRVVAVDGAAVRSVAELATRLYGDPPGTQLRMTVARDGATFATTVVLTD